MGRTEFVLYVKARSPTNQTPVLFRGMLKATQNIRLKLNNKKLRVCKLLTVTTMKEIEAAICEFPVSPSVLFCNFSFLKSFLNYESNSTKKKKRNL